MDKDCYNAELHNTQLHTYFALYLVYFGYQDVEVCFYRTTSVYWSELKIISTGGAEYWRRKPNGVCACAEGSCDHVVDARGLQTSNAHVRRLLRKTSGGVGTLRENSGGVGTLRVPIWKNSSAVPGYPRWRAVWKETPRVTWQIRTRLCHIWEKERDKWVYIYFWSILCAWAYTAPATFPHLATVGKQ